MLRPKKPVVMIIKLPQRMKNEWKPTKAKRIAQVSFQVKIDGSKGSRTARSETREIQNNN